MRRVESGLSNGSRDTDTTPVRVIRLSRGPLAGLGVGLVAALGFAGGLSLLAPPEAAPPYTAPVAVTGTPTSEPVDTVDPAAAAKLAQRVLAKRATAAGEASQIARSPLDARIPARVLAAYRTGEQVTAERAPQCHLPWWLLAGIGRVESGHAAGGAVDASGTTTWPIRGPRLDGTTPGTAVITDTDGGALDSDPEYDRAVGPMQFIPGTWVMSAVDGNGDSRTDPDHVDDAAASAGVYLCSGGEDLREPAALARAVLRYNASQAYLEEVLAGAVAYREGLPIEAPTIDRRSTAVPRPPATVRPPATGTPATASGAPRAIARPTATGTPTTRAVAPGPTTGGPPSGSPTTGTPTTGSPTTGTPTTGTPTTGTRVETPATAGPAPTRPPVVTPPPTTPAASPTPTGAPATTAAPHPSVTSTTAPPSRPAVPPAPGDSPTCVPVTPTSATPASGSSVTSPPSARRPGPGATADPTATATPTLPPCPTPTGH